MSWDTDVVAAIVALLEPLRDDDRAGGSQAYMKDIAPFLGIPARPRRQAQAEAWRGLPAPDDAELEAAARTLWGLPEREYVYAACDLLARYVAVLPSSALAGFVRDLLTTHPWWDSVDALGSAVVNPLVVRYPQLVDTMWEWNRDPDMWLIRASIQHQRGRKRQTDVALVLAMAQPHAADTRFFVAKAIGWALRDLTAIDARAVEDFLAANPELPGVARREALRGLARVSTDRG
jgi:3-methyladenine DNA glycosylase AlkD